MPFLYSHWVALPLPTRVAIAAKFGIAKTGSTHVVGDRIQDDGFKIQDVENALNIDKIQEFLGVENTDMNTLFTLLVAKIEGKEELPAPEVVAELNAAAKKNAETPKRKYTKKVTKK